jgi:hypothetical protein
MILHKKENYHSMVLDYTILEQNIIKKFNYIGTAN